MTLAGPGVSFRRALAATISGDALGNLTPLSLIVSEPAKAMYLAGPAGAARALAALTAENFFYTVSVAIYIMLGTAAMLEAFALPDAVARAGIAALVIMAVVLAAAGWLAWQRPSVVSASLARLPYRAASSRRRPRPRLRDPDLRLGRRPREPDCLARLLGDAFPPPQLSRSLADALAPHRHVTPARSLRPRHVPAGRHHHLQSDPVRPRRHAGRIRNRRAGHRRPSGHRRDDGVDRDREEDRVGDLRGRIASTKRIRSSGL